MSDQTVFFDIGGTLIDCPDIFETITRKLVDRWPDQETYDLAMIMKVWSKTPEKMMIDTRPTVFAISTLCH